MLFTNIQLDSFNGTMARFIERLTVEGLEEGKWLMMATINICAILEYGKAGSVVRRCKGLGTKDGANVQAQAEISIMRVMAKKAAAGVPGSVPKPIATVEEEKMDVDGDGKDRDNKLPVVPPAEGASDLDLPQAFKYARQLTFTMLSFVLKKPTVRKPSQYVGSTLNPYLTVTLTFLATVLKHKGVLKLMETSIPWEEMAGFFSSVPRKLMISQGLAIDGNGSFARPGDQWLMLTSGCSPPLPEDWCMRGMEWVGRKVFEREYWKSGEERKAEMEVLSPMEVYGEGTDGKIEDDDDDEGVEKKSGMRCESVRRWVRIVRCAVSISDAVEGFRWVEGSREWRVEGVLKEKIREWREEEKKEREEAGGGLRMPWTLMRKERAYRKRATTPTTTTTTTRSGI